MMKKQFLLGILTVSLLASCGDFSSTPNYNKLDADIVLTNLDEEYYGQSSRLSPTSSTYNEFGSYSSYSIYSSSYRSYGLLLLTDNQTNYVGFYSLVHNRFLIEPFDFIESDVSYSVKNVNASSPINFILSVSRLNDMVIIDSAGNIFYEGISQDWGFSTSSSSVDGENIFRVDLELHDASITISKEYDGYKAFDATTTELSDDPLEEKLTDLSSYGLPGYYCLLERETYYSSITIYKREGEALNYYNSYIIRGTGTDNIFDLFYRKSIFFVGKKIITQSWSLDNEAGVKIYTYSIDILTGESRSLDCDMAIMSSETIKDNEGNNTYAYITCYVGLDAMGAGDYYELIVDENLEVKYDTTGYGFGSFHRLSNGNLYNSETKKIYDSNLSTIGSFAPYTITYLVGPQVFMLSIDNKTGIMDEEGKWLYPLSEDVTIYAPSNEDSLVLIDDDSVYRVEQEGSSLIAIVDENSSFSTYQDYMFRYIEADGYEQIYSRGGQYLFSRTSETYTETYFYSYSSYSYALFYYTEENTTYFNTVTRYGCADFVSYKFPA